MSELEIREASVQDAEALLDIYRYYVDHTAISFEYETPTLEEFQRRIAQIGQDYPYLVALRDGKILGYAYGSQFHERAAYSKCAEVSIYVNKECQKSGVGRALYQELEKRLKSQGLTNLYACISYTLKEDEYLNNNSADFHAHLGYERIGHFHSCGHKFGRIYDMIWMEKLI